MADKRTYVRSPVYLPVSFGDGESVQTGVVLDISREGCRIHSANAAPDLQYLQVRIQLVETRETVWVDLAVRRWVMNGDLGVEFIKMKPEDQALLLMLTGIDEQAGATMDSY